MKLGNIVYVPPVTHTPALSPQAINTLLLQGIRPPLSTLNMTKVVSFPMPTQMRRVTLISQAESMMAWKHAPRRSLPPSGPSHARQGSSRSTLRGYILAGSHPANRCSVSRRGTGREQKANWSQDVLEISSGATKGPPATETFPQIHKPALEQPCSSRQRSCFSIWLQPLRQSPLPLGSYTMLCL